MTLIHVGWWCGDCLSAGLAFVILPVLGWRWYAIISAFPGVLFLMFAPVFLHETPKFLVTKGRMEAANRKLQLVAKQNNYPLPPWARNAHRKWVSPSQKMASEDLARAAAGGPKVKREELSVIGAVLSPK
jgi:MFS family permease